MSILFLYNEAINPQKGGVEKITFILANYFESKGIKVLFLSLKNDQINIDKRQRYLPESSSFTSPINISFFCNLLKENDVRIVINQGGTNPGISNLAYYSKSENVKLISAIHNSLLASIINFSAARKNHYEKLGLNWLLPFTNIKIIKSSLLAIYRLKYSGHYKLLCQKSDFVVLESTKYLPELKYFVKEQTVENVIGIHNPILYDTIANKKKKKELLYVGRINTSQKRVDLLLQIWNSLYGKFPDWTLKIVGGGEELSYIKALSSKLRLQNIHFYGFQDPKPFYETASVFCMTSSFEGLPMTLLESMQYGIVPVAFNSFLSVTEIIEDNVNGRLITPFVLQEYVNSLAAIMSSETLLEKYSNAARRSAKRFDLSNIGEQWISMFKELNTLY